MNMEPVQYLEAIARESEALADAAQRAGLDAPVPSCPDWTVADLVEHIGNVQRWAGRMVETLSPERINRSDLSESPPPGELLAWFRASTAGLVGALAAADPTAPVWTWIPDQRAGFWFRRQAQEVAVHRWDAEGAAGTPNAIESTLAADGVDEWLAMSRSLAAKALAGTGETVHLHCTDVGGEWLVTLTAEGPQVELVHAKGDAAARGTASDLDLYVWGRVDATSLEVFGDASLLERLRGGNVPLISRSTAHRQVAVASAVQVEGPTTPSAGVIPFALWNAVTAAAVLGPYEPSTVPL